MAKKIIIIATGLYLVFAGLYFLRVSLMAVSFIESIKDKLPKNFDPHSFLYAVTPFIIWFVVTGIGILYRKHWARYSLYVFCAVSILFGLLVSGVMVFAIAHAKNLMPTFPIRIVPLILRIIVLIFLPVFFYMFFSRKSVRELFS